MRAALLTVLACTGFSTAVYATAATPCDPQYMDALEARAYLEAQREVAQNQNYILKPDSVLEYTCFDMFVGHFANDQNWGGACDQYPFSDSCRWGTVFMQGAGTLLGSIKGVVLSAMTNYLNGEFSESTYDQRKYLYGRATTAGSYPTPLPASSAANPVYNCTVMEKVWVDAHCYNFMQQADHDAFYDFYWYSSAQNKADPRVMNGDQAWANAGNECTTPINDTGDIEVAFNNQGPKYVLNPENPWQFQNDTTVWKNDPVVTHLDLILPENGGAAPVPVTCANVKPIPTGVCVVRSGWNQAYGDAVCPNPGCYYPAPGAAGTGADPSQCNVANPPVAGACAGP